MTVDANDGIIATAGIVEGFSGAGATLVTLIIAAVSAMIAGTIALAGAKYAEAAGDRDAELAVMEEERRQLALSPQEEFAELVEHYRGRGLSAELAEQVAGRADGRGCPRSPSSSRARAVGVRGDPAGSGGAPRRPLLRGRRRGCRCWRS